MKTCLVVLAVCAFAAAMVPKERRALPDEMLTTNPPEVKTICNPETPCAWSTYKPIIKVIDSTIVNSYPDKLCEILEDDSAVSVYVHRCRSPAELEHEEDDSDS